MPKFLKNRKPCMSSGVKKTQKMVDSSTAAELEIGNLTIRWLGHSTFLIHKLSDGMKILIDPYVEVLHGIENVGLVLSTHAHHDHSGGIDGVTAPDAVVVGPLEVRGKTSREFLEVAPGQDVVEVKGVKVRAVPAYNVNKPYHPKGAGIGLILNIDGTTVYTAGDTDFIPEMKALTNEKIDVALLPIGGTYTMDQDEAVSAALTIRPRIVVPMHYGSVSGTSADVARFKKDVEDASGGSIHVFTF